MAMRQKVVHCRPRRLASGAYKTVIGSDGCAHGESERKGQNDSWDSGVKNEPRVSLIGSLRPSGDVCRRSLILHRRALGCRKPSFPSSLSQCSHPSRHQRLLPYKTGTGSTSLITGHAPSEGASRYQMKIRDSRFGSPGRSVG